MTAIVLPRRPRRHVHDLNPLLRSAGIRQAEAAKLLGVSREWLSLVMAGSRKPSAVLAERLDDMAGAIRLELGKVVDHDHA